MSKLYFVQADGEAYYISAGTMEGAVKTFRRDIGEGEEPDSVALVTVNEMLMEDKHE